ncbi:MAG TPA: histidine kinase, partial [Flavobacteriales bacterium]|nr:histidine kinase [Flavobacteriales bacterium]
MALNEERRRIAADVHDDLGADLSRLLLQVRRTGADPDEYDNRIRQGITAAINKIDEIIWSLDPRRDTLEGTLTFAEQLAIEICEANGMSFRTNVQLTDRRIPLSAKARREVFLIIKESIRNVVEHACATTLRLGAEMAGEVVVISIEDDGVGFLPTISTPRNGMKNMR